MHHQNLSLMKGFLRDIGYSRKFRTVHNRLISDTHRMTAERTDTIGNTPKIRIPRNTSDMDIKTDRHRLILVFFRQDRNLFPLKPSKQLFARQSQRHLRANVQNAHYEKNPSNAPAINALVPRHWLRKKSHARRCAPTRP